MRVTFDVHRAGLWRRGFALLIDLILAQLILQSFAAAAFPLSGGRIVDMNSFFTSCVPATAQPAEARVPADFQPTARQICMKSFFGFPTGRAYVVQHEAKGAVTTTTSVTMPIDAAGRTTKVLDIGFLQVLVLIVMRWAFDRMTLGSPGRRLARVRLVEVSKLDGPEGTQFSAITRRYLLFALPIVPGLVASAALISYGVAVGEPSAAMEAMAGLLGGVPLTVAIVGAVLAIQRRQDAFYDESSGTAVATLAHGAVEVVDGPAPSPPPRTAFRALLAGSVRGAAREWPWLTTGLVLVLVATFAAEMLRPIAAIGPNGAVAMPTLVIFGGASQELVVQIGQWYRLVTAIFLHVSALHLFANALILLLAGWVLEGLLGRGWLLTVFLVGGIAGSATSVLWNPPAMVTVGASGAMMALLAAGLVVSPGLPAGPRQRWTKAFCLGVGVPTLLTSGHFGTATIDVADHVGGAVGGVVLGIVMLASRLNGMPQPRYGMAALGVALALFAGLFASIPLAGFGDAPMSALLVPNDKQPKTDEEWMARSADLVRRYPTDPRPHLARAVLEEREGNAVERDREFARAIESERRVAPANARSFESNAFNTLAEATARRHDWRAAQDLYTRAIALVPAKPEAYMKRADVELAQTLFDQAVSDLHRAASLDPKNGKIQAALGGTLFAEGDTPGALAAYDRAVDLAPEEAATIRGRGWTAFFAGRQAAALLDLEAGAKLDPKDAYAALWLDIVAVRSGSPDRIVAAARDLDLQAWPGPVVKFYLGQIDEKALDSAAADPDPVKAEEQRCETNFYVGEWNVMRRFNRIARPYLSAALAGCPKNFDEWAAASAELKGAAGYRPDEFGLDAQ